MSSDPPSRPPTPLSSPLRFTTNARGAGHRLDQVISDQIPEISRTLARRLIDLGGVHVDGRRIRRCGQVLRNGQSVEIHRDAGPTEPFRLTQQDIIFRDRFLIAVNKPPGIETQPTPARYKGTLYEALLAYLHDPFRPRQRPELGMAQRLDRDTSGVLVFSTHPRSHGPLTRSLAEREVRKVYLALVKGRPSLDEGEICTRLARKRSNNKVVSVERGGKEAITRFQIVESFSDASLLAVEILTGRSHQIRAHMAEAGHPILGDLRYGGPFLLRGEEVARQMLHSTRLEMKHPVEGNLLQFEAPLPEDFQKLLGIFRGGSSLPDQLRP